MRRRTFNRYLSFGLPMLTFPAIMKENSLKEKKKKPLLKARRLRKGATIGLITPGSPVSDEKFEKALKSLKSLGFKLKYSPNTRANYGYLAGTDQQRLNDIHQMFSDPEVEAIWCVRGGYGCARLLPHLDYELIRKNPKILIGYSDITALLTGIFQETGLVCFHGPVGTSDFTDYTLSQLESVLMNPEGQSLITYHQDEKAQEDEAYQYEVIRPGLAKGPLIGGNLSLIASMVGTPYEWRVKDKLLLIEDVGEQPYRIDRMLTQILQSQNLKEAAGIILGIFEDCKAKNPEYSLSLIDALKDRLYHLGIPVVYGFSFGHISNQCTFPIGIEAELDTEKRTVRLLDQAVL